MRWLLLLLALAGCAEIRLARPLAVQPGAAPAPPLVRLWERDVDAAFGSAAPVVGPDYIAVGTRRGEVVVLDARTGARIGAQSFGDAIEGGLAVSADGTRLFVPVARGRAGVVAFDVRTGQRAWDWRGGSVRAGLVVVEGIVVVAAHDGAVVGLDAATGAERWRIEPEAAGPGGAQHAATPLDVGADVVVADSNGRVRRIEARSGRVVAGWQASGPVLAPLARSGDVLAAPTTRGVLHLRTVRGEAIPEGPPEVGVRGRTRIAVAPDPAGGFVAAGTDGSVVHTERTWTATVGGGVVATPLVAGGLAWIGTTDRHLVALDVATGEERWRTRTRGRVKSAAAAGGGVVIVLTEPRHVAAYGPAALAAAR